MTPPAATPETLAAHRDRSIDALRGFALMGVIVVNAPIFAMPIDAGPALATPADRIAAWATLAFGAGKFFLIFSFLYGFGLSVALDRAARPGGSGAPLRRRLVALLAIGVAHATLLFYGDILMLYALLGVALVALRDASPRRLAAMAAGSLALAVCAQAGIIALALGETAPLGPIDRIAGVGYLGGLGETVAVRLADLPSALVFLLAFNGPAAFAMVLAGRLAARSGAFPPSPARLAAWRRRAPLAL
ncbi:DUF418 domain-containing protein, partial [Salinarimonas sp. NSM]|uniref:DUF418 domain-containing protein n=1 Tax=Salinarimonas sp. NSM TaxID=3458003 RepID=UPI004036EDD6